QLVDDALQARLGLGARLADAHRDGAHVELADDALDRVDHVLGRIAVRDDDDPSCAHSPRPLAKSRCLTVRGWRRGSRFASSCTTATERWRPPVQPTAT